MPVATCANVRPELVYYNKMQRIILMLLVLCLAASTSAKADDIADGMRLAKRNCATCHALDATGDSPLKEAPPFRKIHEMYDDGELEDAFNDGIVASHPAMPDWKMSSDQARELAAYIMSLAKR